MNFSRLLKDVRQIIKHPLTDNGIYGLLSVNSTRYVREIGVKIEFV